MRGKCHTQFASCVWSGWTSVVVCWQSCSFGSFLPFRLHNRTRAWRASSKHWEMPRRRMWMGRKFSKSPSKRWNFWTNYSSPDHMEAELKSWTSFCGRSMTRLLWTCRSARSAVQSLWAQVVSAKVPSGSTWCDGGSTMMRSCQRQGFRRWFSILEWPSSR